MLFLAVHTVAMVTYDIKVFTNDWQFFDTMIVASTDQK